MVKFRFIALALSICLLAACAPSAQAIQTAVAKTQAAYTPTPTLVPTPTKNPCTDRGWADIDTYLKQFDAQMKNIAVGMSIQTYLDSLRNYQAKINNVDIDACTEHARQTLIAGMGNLIMGMQIAMTNGKQEDSTAAVTQGVTMIKDAKAELSTLGINFVYP